MPSPLLHTGDFLTHGLALTLLVFVGSFYYDELDAKLPSNAHGASTLYYKVEMEKQEALLAARETSNTIAKATVKGNAETLEQAMMAHKIEMNEVLEARQAEDALLRAQQEEKFDQLLKVVHALQQAQHTGEPQIAAITMAMAEHQKQLDKFQNQQCYLEKIATASETIATVQAQVHGYTTMRMWRIKLGRIIFGLGLLGSIMAYWNPSGAERKILLQICTSRAGAGVIAGTLGFYFIVHEL